MKMNRAMLFAGKPEIKARLAEFRSAVETVEDLDQSKELVFQAHVKRQFDKIMLKQAESEDVESKLYWDRLGRDALKRWKISNNDDPGAQQMQYAESLKLTRRQKVGLYFKRFKLAASVKGIELKLLAVGLWHQMTQTPLDRQIEKAKAKNSPDLPELLAQQDAQEALGEAIKALGTELADSERLSSLTEFVKEQEEAIKEFEQETGRFLTDTEKMLLSHCLAPMYFPVVWLQKKEAEQKAGPADNQQSEKRLDLPQQ